MGSSVTLLLDSVILIDHFNGIPDATEYIASVSDQCAISVITRAEVLAGFEAKGRRAAIQLLDQFPLFPIDQVLADLAARLRREQGWKLPDAFQAAIAKHHGLRLVTRNTRDFPPQRYRFVLLPYTLT